MKILLVEDQDLERRRTKDLLETNGFVIDEARNAEEAIGYARTYDYDAGIVDLHLTSPPRNMEGLELIGAVRRLRRAYYPILVLTSVSEFRRVSSRRCEAMRQESAPSPTRAIRTKPT